MDGSDMSPESRHADQYSYTAYSARCEGADIDVACLALCL